MCINVPNWEKPYIKSSWYSYHCYLVKWLAIYGVTAFVTLISVDVSGPLFKFTSMLKFVFLFYRTLIAAKAAAWAWAAFWAWVTMLFP